MPNAKVPTYQQPTKASRIKAAEEQNSSTHVRSTVPTLVSASSPSRGPKLAHKDFRDRVFKNYGIQFEQEVDLRTPYQHFGTEEPDAVTEPLVSHWYQQRHKHCEIWLSLKEEDAEDVAQQYANMIAIQSNEAKLSHRGKIYFFKEDKIYAPTDKTRCSSSYFELEWSPNPDGELLLCPPSLDTKSGISFSFNTNPDCTYWLTTRRMNPNYRNDIPMITYVLPHADATSPYLTVEFKKKSVDFEAAVNQLGVSATLALYNRFRLRCQRLQAKKLGLEPNHFQDIKHYAIAVNGSSARFYLAKPVLSTIPTKKPDELWRGCNLRHFRTIDAMLAEGVLQIRAWINEIHNWGLGEHSTQFEADVKGIFSEVEGGDRVSLTHLDIEALNRHHNIPTEDGSKDQGSAEKVLDERKESAL